METKTWLYNSVLEHSLHSLLWQKLFRVHQIPHFFPPGHTVRLHSPVSFAVSCLYGMSADQRKVIRREVHHCQAWLVKPCRVLSALLILGPPHLLDTWRESSGRGLPKGWGTIRWKEPESLNDHMEQSVGIYHHHPCPPPHTHRAGLLGTVSWVRNKQLLHHWSLGGCMLQQLAITTLSLYDKPTQCVTLGRMMTERHFRWSRRFRDYQAWI